MSEKNHTDTIHTDIVIVGGGIAGLWLLNRLHNSGYHALLLENNVLGGGQTIASQGMIHGGIKYALSGALTTAANTIAQMPDHWRSCIAGQGDVDLTSCKVLSEHYYMWSSDSYRSRLNTFLGSKALRGRISAVEEEAYPEVFRNNQFKGSLYQLADIVLDLPSLLETLSKPHAHRLYKVDWKRGARFQYNQQGIEYIAFNTEQGELALRAQSYVFCAGEGNQELLTMLQIEQVQMQLRPLHMVAVKHRHPHAIYVHCVGNNLSTVPQLTISSHPIDDGYWVWYIGGDLAETGVKRSRSEQIDVAKKQLGARFPWIDFSQAQWQSFFINRAEPKQSSISRPDDAYVHCINNIFLCWPTKLTLAPSLAQSVLKQLHKKNIAPNPETNTDVLSRVLAKPALAQAKWEQLFQCT